MRPQDIKPGMYVVLVGEKKKEEQEYKEEVSWGFFGPSRRQYEEETWTGSPMLVRAVNLPFILVEGLTSYCAVDSRKFIFTPASKEYVEEYVKLYRAAVPKGNRPTVVNSWVINELNKELRESECNGI